MKPEDALKLGFRRVELRTYGDALVQVVWIPPFKRAPEVLMWGERFFVFGTEGVYREGLVHVAVIEGDVPAGA